MTVATITSCHHPRCGTSIRADQFACNRHWHQLPIRLRNRIWRARRRGDRAAHGQAVTEALHHWIAELEASERLPRCHNCKSEALGTDPESGLGICLTCAKGELGGTPTEESCPGCGRPALLLVSVETTDDIGPYLCPDCHLRRAT